MTAADSAGVSCPTFPDREFAVNSRCFLPASAHC
jgi:hypothetical protein